MSDKFIPLSIPNIKGNELAYVTKAVQAEWVSTSGGDISLFENDFAKFLNIENACAVQSGTAALHLCLRHFGIGKNDIVLVPTLTFIATINPVLYQDAEPIFFDCDDHLCINVNQVEDFLKEHCIFDGKKTIDKVSGKTVKAIIPVHIFGDYTDMNKLMPLAEKYNLVVIEDATEALGTKIVDGQFKNINVGKIGHAAAFSFNGNKIMTTGGGGMVVSKDKMIIDHIRYLSQQAKDDAVYFVNNEVGYNYRMTNLQAAMGRGQLEQVDNFIKVKQENYKLYNHLLKDTPYKMLQFRNAESSNCWFYSLLTGNDNSNERDQLIVWLKENNIQSRPIWTLNHRQKPFLNYRKMDTSKAEFYYNQVVNLPCSTNLTEDDIKCVVDVIKKFKFKA